MEARPPEDPRHHLPRLPPEYYRGFAAVHWTLTIRDRRRGWLDDRFHARFREVLLHSLARHGCSCPVYCLMPDHVHLLIVGWSEAADQLLFARFLKRHVNELLSDRLKECEFQRESHDHVMRRDEIGETEFKKCRALHRRESGGSRIGDGCQGLRLHQRDAARIPETGFLGRKVLARFLECDQQAPGRSERRLESSSVAALVKVRENRPPVDRTSILPAFSLRGFATRSAATRSQNVAHVRMMRPKTILLPLLAGAVFGCITGWIGAWIQHYNESNFGAEYSRFRFDWLAFPALPGAAITFLRLRHDLQIDEAWLFRWQICGWNGAFWATSFAAISLLRSRTCESAGT